VSFGYRRLEQKVDDLFKHIEALSKQVDAVSSRIETLECSTDKNFRETRALLSSSDSETRTLLNGTLNEARSSLHEDINAVRLDLAPRIEVIRTEVSRIQSPKPPEGAPEAEGETKEDRESEPPGGSGSTATQHPVEEPTVEDEAGGQSAAEATVEDAPKPGQEEAADGRKPRQTEERTVGEDEPQPTSGTCHLDRAEFDAHCEALRAAASVTSVRLNCHRDLWAFLVDKSAHVAHFRTPGEAVDLGDGRVQVPLSGPSLIAVLTALWEMRCLGRTPGERLGDWAQASVLYDSVSAALADLEKGARGGADHLDIHIDLRSREKQAEPGEGRVSEEDDEGRESTPADESRSTDDESRSTKEDDRPEADEPEADGGGKTPPADD
jgi:hypothetical protein